MITQPVAFSPAVAGAPVSDADAIVGSRVELQRLTTLKCNLKCSYCSLGVGEVLGSQTELQYDIDQLAAFVERHLRDKEVYVTFYGGEPMLNRAMMEAVMRRFPLFRFQLQTNGTLLDSLPDWVLHKLSNILVSIDGGERTTDGYRGRELYAGLTQCRVSTHLLNVMPDGKIFPCPDMMYLPSMQMGEIQGNWLKKTPLQPHPDMPCEACEAFSWCRCNCMKNLYLGYVKKDRRYRANVVEPICDLVRFMGREIDRHDPHAWFAQAALPVRKRVTDAEVYEYVEIMP